MNLVKKFRCQVNSAKLSRFREGCVTWGRTPTCKWSNKGLKSLAQLAAPHCDSGYSRSKAYAVGLTRLGLPEITLLLDFFQVFPIRDLAQLCSCFMVIPLYLLNFLDYHLSFPDFITIKPCHTSNPVFSVLVFSGFILPINRIFQPFPSN